MYLDFEKGDEILIKQSVEKVEEEQNRAEQNRTEGSHSFINYTNVFLSYMQLKHVFLY